MFYKSDEKNTNLKQDMETQKNKFHFLYEHVEKTKKI